MLIIIIIIIIIIIKNIYKYYINRIIIIIIIIELIITEQYGSSEQYSMRCALKTKDSEKGGRGEGGGGRVGEGAGGCRTIDLLLCLICYCDVGGEYTGPRYVALKPFSITFLMMTMTSPFLKDSSFSD